MEIKMADSQDESSGLNREGKGESGYQILIVDDDNSILELNRKILARHGHSVVVARDGAEALEVFCRHIDELGLIITDFQMPRMNGLEFFRRVRKMLPQLPVIMLTGAYSQLKDELEFDRNTLVVKKPCKAATLLAHIDQLMAI